MLSTKGYQKVTTINTSVDKVRGLLTSINGLKAWWENPVSGSPEAGGKLRFGFNESDDYAIMKVKKQNTSGVLWEVIEDTGYDGEWVGTEISFEIKELHPAQTELSFTHIGLTPELTSYQGCVGGWNYFLDNIKNQAES